MSQTQQRMKHLILPFLFVLTVTVTHAQKLKGTRNVTVSEREITAFDSIEITNNVEVFLTKGDVASLEIEADDNLHESISVFQTQGMLRIGSTQEVSSFKKYSVKITYAEDLNLIVAKGTVLITGLTDITSSDLTIKLFDNTKLYANLRSDKFTLMAHDKTKVEMNLVAPETVLELNHNAQVKALITATQFKADLYNKANAQIEGDVQKGKFMLDNSADFTGKNLTTLLADIQLNDQAKLSLEVTQKAVISATGSSFLELHNEQKLEVNQFTDRAVISKKNNKIK